MTAKFKDYFSDSSKEYSRYRPNYPVELFSYLAAISVHHQKAWDCATGSGQAALQLAEHFAEVIATDASESQIRNAAEKENIHYQVATAENSNITSNSIDLIAVAQAFHWFDIEAFSVEANRVLKEDGILAIWTYNLLSISDDIDEIVGHLYGSILEKYWAFERRMVENGYSSVQLPFKELDAPAFYMHSKWSLPKLLGYLSTWSAVKKYQQETGNDPVEELYEDILAAWGQPDQLLPVSWPLGIRVWKKHNPPP